MSAFLPPRGFITTAMDLAMMAAAERYVELVTDLATECSLLHEAQMMRICRMRPQMRHNCLATNLT